MSDPTERRKRTSERKQLRAPISPDAHHDWGAAADTHGISVAALVESMAPWVEQILADRPVIVTVARSVDVISRRRGQ